ncbi:MAG: ATP-binding protein [Anaerolineales bacterium]
MVQALSSIPPDHSLRDELCHRVMSLMLGALIASGTAAILVVEATGGPLSASLLGFGLIVLALVTWGVQAHLANVARVLLIVGLGIAATLTSQLIDPCAGLVLLLFAGPLAVLLLGPTGGLGAALICSLLLLIPTPHRLAAIAVFLAIFAIWVLTALVWTALDSTQEAVLWWAQTYEQTRKLLDEARTQRVRLMQTQEDLVKANQELARVSERLRAMREMADEARRAKEQFVANVSHELRTPLNMIIGFSDMIARAPHIYGADLPPQLLADIEVILSSSKHLASLVDDVLDLSQVDSGRVALSREWCQLGDIARAAALAVTPLFDHKNLALTLHVPEDLAPVYCDPVRIRQVILNLLSNAGRFTDQGGAVLAIAPEDGVLHVTVSDTGPGISPESQRLIFEPFSQADGSIRRRYGGSGLGLAISKRFVELHNGRMWFESTTGEGSVFHFTLPLEERTPLDATSARRWFTTDAEYERQPRPSLAPRPRVTPRFVVVERGDTLQRMLGRYEEGIEVVGVRTVEEAIREISRLPAHALLLNDRRFEQGALAPQELAALAYGTPVVACWVPGQAEAAERLGLVRYLLKPVSREELLGALDALPGPVRTVLVVDDEPEALQLFGRILTSADAGYHVLRASSGQRALTLLRERQPDVMLLDLVMPGMDGYTLLRAKSLDETIRHIPTIAISAQDPMAGPIASSSLTISRSGGLQMQDLLNVIKLTVQTLAPPDQLDPAPSGRPPA